MPNVLVFSALIKRFLQCTNTIQVLDRGENEVGDHEGVELSPDGATRMQRHVDVSGDETIGQLTTKPGHLHSRGVSPEFIW